MVLDSLRKPFFFIAVALLVIAFLVEIGSKLYLGSGKVDLPNPGLGIPYLALIDGLLLFTIALMGFALLVPDRIHGKIQGIATFLVALFVLIGAITSIFVAIALLMLMISLLLAVPFGTIVYFATYANFAVAPAAATLSLVMILKLGFAVCLILAHQRFLQNKGLVLLILTSLLATIILSFLHGIVPRFLAYITDDIGAIIAAVLAAIWALVFLIGSIPAIIKALRVDRALG